MEEKEGERKGKEVMRKKERGGRGKGEGEGKGREGIGMGGKVYGVRGRREKGREKGRGEKI